MAEEKQKDPGPTASAATEIALDDIDRILEEDDPEFTSSLTELKAIGADPEVVIESAVAGEEILSVEEEGGRKKGLIARFPILEKLLLPITRLRSKFYTRWLKLKAGFVILLRQLWAGAKTLPGKGLVSAKAGVKATRAGVNAGLDLYDGLTWAKRIAFFSSLLLAVGVGFVLYLNLRGVWVPLIDKPPLSSFADVADSATRYNPATEFEPFLRAFPQEQHVFLFPKIVVNLRRGSGHPNPMAAFEFIVETDSKDSAVEVQQRQQELHDALQRTIEGQSYRDVESRLGKERLKDLLRKTLNDLLTQGWVKDIYVKTMVIKP